MQKLPFHDRVLDSQEVRLSASKRSEREWVEQNRSRGQEDSAHLYVGVSPVRCPLAFPLCAS